MNGPENKQQMITESAEHFPREMLLAGSASNSRRSNAPSPNVNPHPNAAGSFWKAPSLTDIENEAAFAAQNLIKNFPRKQD